jgi:hypothetical protein
MARERIGRAHAGARKVASDGIKVTAVSRHSGRPATAVDVEVDPVRLKQAIGEYGRVTAVVAEIPGPASGDGVAHSTLEPLHPVGQAATPPGQGAVQHYSATHLGPSDPRRGVEISVETEAGTVEAQGPGESYSVCEEGQPAQSSRRPRQGS